jgi:hypothetical protein
LLIDQIAQKLSFVAAQQDVKAHKTGAGTAPTKGESLIDRVVKIFQEFLRHYATTTASVPVETEAQLMGALAGFISTVAPELAFTTGRVYRDERPIYVDMEIKRGDELVLVELKRGQNRALIEQGVNQLFHYLQIAKAKDGVLFLYSGKAAEYDVDLVKDHHSNKEVSIIHPKAAS